MNGSSKQRHKWWCKACQKWSYGSEARAIEAMGYVAVVFLGTGRKIPKRTYPCDYGNGHHLTSSEQKV